MSRMPWSTYFMEIAFFVAKRSTCLRRKVGAVAINNKRILATGYNGPPSNIQHCEVEGCLRQKQRIPSGKNNEICLGLHAEQNVIIQAAMYAVSLKNAVFYCTIQPCIVCTKMLINCQVEAIYYAGAYNDDLAEYMLKKAGIHYELLREDSHIS